MSFSDSDVFERLVRWVRSTVDLQAIRSDAMPSAKRPDGQYVTLKIYSSKVNNQRIIESEKECIKQQKVLRISINVYRGNASDVAHVLSASLSSVLVSMTHFSGVGFVQVSDIKDISTRIKNESEDRANFDIEIRNCKTLSIGEVKAISLGVTVCRKAGVKDIQQY